MMAQDRAPQLTLITDTTCLSDEKFFDAVQHALLGGVDAVLVREKQLTSAKLLALASRLRVLTHACHARLMIHSQADIAVAVDADGVHLASADMPGAAAVRQWLANSQKTVSVSCHNADELAQAADCGADYVMLSPVFATASHPGAPYLGVERFHALAAASTLPVVALGGINTVTCKALQGYPMAAIGALQNTADSRLSAQQLRAAVDAQ